MASFINDHFHPFIPVSGDQIFVGGSVTSIENMLAFSIGDPGDGILVSSPIYGRFELDFGNEARLNIVYAPMEGVDSFSINIIGQLEKGMVEAEKNATRVRALLISNPSNPLGPYSLT
jgi:1-aminocyclopropane-1-carboxylate synthase